MKYKVVLTKTAEGYSVRCPGLPGCWSQGATEAAAIENIRDAIGEYQAAMSVARARRPVSAAGRRRCRRS